MKCRNLHQFIFLANNFRKVFLIDNFAMTYVREIHSLYIVKINLGISVCGDKLL